MVREDATPASGTAATGGAGPKYLNTSDNDVYHKGLHLYGANLARPFAARAGEVILCEGYTDTIALHQAGMRNAVGLMGTALTGEQVGELARMAQTVLLALDADSAGQEAMLRASTLAAKRKLELRVVALPAGTDPAELVQREGPEAMSEAVKESVHFLRFRVERVLANGDHSSPEGQDRMIDELGPVFAQLEPSAMRMELTELVSSRLAVKGSILEQRLSSHRRRGRSAHQDTQMKGDRPADSAGARGRGLSGREDTERAFLALCIASPEEGAVALESIEVDEHFASELLRRAARRLREGNLREPMVSSSGREGGPHDDPELEELLAELTVQAGREETRPAMLEVQRLQLEMARMDRKIHQARGQHDGDVSGWRSAARRSSASSIAPTNGCSRRRGIGRGEFWPRSSDACGARAGARPPRVTNVAHSRNSRTYVRMFPSQALRRIRCMDSLSLERFLTQGLSLQAIGRRLGPHEATVAYWVEQYGLQAANHDRHLPRGALRKRT